MSAPEYPIKTIAEIINGELIQLNSNEVVKSLILDSRRASAFTNSLFFAIKGSRHDGHDYVSDLYAKGVRNFVVSQHRKDFDLLQDANFISVDNALTVLQKLATFHKKQFNLKTIAITGSNGKTVVKEWLFQLLQKDFSIVRSPKSFNSQIGVPLSVWNINNAYNMGIFEAGISHPLEMENLANIIQPEIGIITNIGQAHQENFSSYKEKIQEKLKLFINVKTLIYRADYPELEAEILNNPDFEKKNLLSWSTNKPADLQITVNSAENGTELQGTYKSQRISIKIPFSDKASIENACHCWLLLLHLKIDHKVIFERFKKLNPVAMRLQLLDGINNCSIINDAYNSDPGSLEIALDVLNQQKQNKKNTIILSDILQSGIKKELLYEEIAQIVIQKKVDFLIGIGPDISQFAHLFKSIDSEFYSGTEAYLKDFKGERYNSENILIKGARTFQFEKISSLLQKKSHETVLEINLSHIISNLNYFKEKIKPSTKVMAMVKAFSYGSGSFEIANLLEFNRIDYLAVAYVDEGVELRKAGISVPIVVMNPEVSEYDAMIYYQLEPEIYNLRTLKGFIAEIDNKDLINPFPIHLKVDTGMRRLGFEKGDLKVLSDILKSNNEIRVSSIFSHLAGSDNPELDKFTLQQIEQFSAMATEIESTLGYKTIRHILNSAGVARFPQAQFDMVRLGLGMYGIGVTQSDKENLKLVSRLKTVISQIKSVPEGESVGYNRASFTNENSKIATLPIGYADGLSRMLGNGNGKVFINGFRAPFIGNICMDMSMVDISNIPCKEGDDVEIFGEEIKIEEFANDLKTIPYEVLTHISRRVKRVYYQD